jgi:5-methylcytosine-specific restriction enzyme A
VKISNPYGRAIEEWSSGDPDQKPPPHVQLRIWDRQHGRCYLTGRPINVGDKKQLDHIKALADGGENRESNMAWILIGAHRQKTGDENSRRSDERSIKKKHFGIEKQVGPDRPIQSAPMPTTRRAAERAKREPRQPANGMPRLYRALGMDKS